MSDLAESIFDSDLSSLEVPGFEAAPAAPVDETPAVEAAAEVPVDGPADVESPATPPEAQVTPEAATSAKVLKFKAGDKEVPLDETAQVPWKIDGKTEMVAVKDLLTNYAGKVAYDRKFQELSKQREEAMTKVSTFERNQARHSQLINDMHKSVTEGRTFDAVQNMLEMTGLDKKMDARTYVNQLRTSLFEQAKRMEGMTDEQRDAVSLKEENDFLKAKGARETEARTREQADTAFQARVAKSVSEANSTVEEFVKARDWIVQSLKTNREDTSIVTPEYVANHIRDVRDYSTAKEALNAVSPDLIKNEKLWDDTVDALRKNPEWTAKDLEDILRKATAQKRTTSINDKVNQSPVATAAAASTKTKKTDPRLDMKTFTAADLDW